MARRMESLVGGQCPKWRNASIGCVGSVAPTQSGSASFSAILGADWAKPRANPPKPPNALSNCNHDHNVIRGWANREAAWSISRLTNALRRHIEIAVGSLPRSVSSAWLAMRCSNQHSSPRQWGNWVHLSRNSHPPKHDVPHTPPRRGRYPSVPALLCFGSWGDVPC